MQKCGSRRDNQTRNIDIIDLCNDSCSSLNRDLISLIHLVLLLLLLTINNNNNTPEIVFIV